MAESLRSNRLFRQPHLRSRPQQVLFFTISVRNHWVARKNCDILWLPSNRRRGVYAIKNNLLAIGNRSGVMTFLSFITAFLPVWNYNRDNDYEEYENVLFPHERLFRHWMPTLRLGSQWDETFPLSKYVGDSKCQYQILHSSTKNSSPSPSSRFQFLSKSSRGKKYPRVFHSQRSVTKMSCNIPNPSNAEGNSFPTLVDS